MAKKKKETEAPKNKTSEVLANLKEHDSFAATPHIDIIPTGISALDNSMGGGLPIGVMTEWYGKEGVGKTSLALKLSKTFLNLGYGVVYIDTELALTKERVLAHGIDPDTDTNFIYRQTNDLDQIFIIIDTLLKSKMASGDTESPVLVIIDSIASASVQVTDTSALGAPVSKNTSVAAEAKIWTNELRRRQLALKKYKITLFLINQTRQTFNQGGFGGWGATNDEHSWGANFIKYAAQIRVFLKHAGNKFMAKEKYTDRMIKVTYDKNKIGKHYDTVIIFDYLHGYSETWSTFYSLKSNKYIKAAGQKWTAVWDTDKDEYKSFTKNKFVKMFNEDMEFRKLVYDFLRSEGFIVHNYYYVSGLESYSDDDIKLAHVLDVDVDPDEAVFFNAPEKAIANEDADNVEEQKETK